MTPKPLTSAQIRAARALIRWSAQELADASSVGVTTIRRAELTQSETKLTRANDQAIRRALEAAGVEFIDAEGGGPGVSTGFIATAMDLAIARQGSCSFQGITI